jgi:hypothetical protein
LCKHNKRKAECQECGGSAFCKHNKRKAYVIHDIDIDFNGKEYKANAYVASCGKQVLVVYQVDGSEERMAWEDFEDRRRGSHDAFHSRQSGRRTSPSSFPRAQRDSHALTMRAAMDDDDDERDAYDSDATDCTEIGGFAVFCKRCL